MQKIGLIHLLNSSGIPIADVIWNYPSVLRSRYLYLSGIMYEQVAQDTDQHWQYRALGPCHDHDTTNLLVTWLPDAPPEPPSWEQVDRWFQSYYGHESVSMSRLADLRQLLVRLRTLLDTPVPIDPFITQEPYEPETTETR